MKCLFLLAAVGSLCLAWAVKAAAQTAISVDGAVESTSGGFKFPDGTLQTTAFGPSLAPVADTGQQACYDPSGLTTDEASCAGTGQDGEKQAGVDWPAPRFTDNLDGTVTDNLTGLIWLKNAACALFLGHRVFAPALTKTSKLSEGFCDLIDGSQPGDWRLPNLKELRSLMDYGQSGPALPTGHPFTNVVLDYYWSSTSTAWLPSGAWIVSTDNGATFTDNKFSSRYVWPVRGGQ